MIIAHLPCVEGVPETVLSCKAVFAIGLRKNKAARSGQLYFSLKRTESADAAAAPYYTYSPLSASQSISGRSAHEHRYPA